jgi:hypothetical protein
MYQTVVTSDPTHGDYYTVSVQLTGSRIFIMVQLAPINKVTHPVLYRKSEKFPTSFKHRMKNIANVDGDGSCMK